MSERTLDIASLPPLPEYEHDWEINKPYAFKDMGLVIEFKCGDTRTKTKDNGVLVYGTMPSAYGFIVGTTDIHGEEIDFYLAGLPNPDSDIYIIDQVDPVTGAFDEHKVMLGFDSPDEALTTYVSAFSDGSGWGRIGAITTFPGLTFHLWLLHEGYSLQPASKYTAEGVVTANMRGFSVPRPNPKSLPKPIDETGGVQISLPDLSQGPKILTKASPAGGLTYIVNLVSPLDQVAWSNLTDRLCRTLHFASEQDEFEFKIASPGGSVFLMGRIVSAIKVTKAHVKTFAQGPVASAATTIWAAGHERYILPGAYFMQHMSSQQLGGKTSDIAEKSIFCREYIRSQLNEIEAIGLFTSQEVSDMVDKASDIFISGREAIRRVGSLDRSTKESV